MQTETLSAPVEIHPPADEKIGEGQYREVFRSDPFVIKKLKRFLFKRRGQKMAPFPLQSYVRKKYGIDDFNQHEFAHYQMLAEVVPARLRDNFNPIHWAGHFQGHSLSLSDLVLNADGSLAQTMVHTGPIRESGFWRVLDEMEIFLLDHKLYFTGLSSDNILVCKREEGWQPVMVDYKWLGGEAYPCQFWLRCRAGLENKIRHKFLKMKQLFQST